jgi:hypothetical protein
MMNDEIDASGSTYSRADMKIGGDEISPPTGALTAPPP